MRSSLFARGLMRTLLFGALGVLCAWTQIRPQAPATARDSAATARALRIVVSLSARRLWVVAANGDTLRSAPVAVGSRKTLSDGSRSWTFRTPTGIRTVLSKETDPVWIRPDWAYVEVAREYGFRLDSVSESRPRSVGLGRTLIVRGGEVGIIARDSAFEALPVDDEIVFGDVLYIPPLGTSNREVAGTLGAYRLNLGDGIGLHGTPDKGSVGHAVTHGCMRLGDDDLAWVFANVPVGTRVYIY